MVETVLTVLLVAFILLILISFPVIGGGMAYFYIYKKRFSRQQISDKLRYDFISSEQQHQMSMAGTLTLQNYYPSRSRSSSTFLEAMNRSNSESSIPELTSASALVVSKSVASDFQGTMGQAKGSTFSPATTLQQKLFANKVCY